MYKVLWVLPGDLRHRPSQPHHETQKEGGMSFCKLNHYLFGFQDLFFYFFLSFQP
jgi:hypothetical protein